LKVLILKPSSLGDVVQALPVLRLLKAHQPASQIYWWISSDLYSLLEGDPDLTGIFTFDRRRLDQPQAWRQFFRTIRAMRALRFDLVLDLQALARSGFVCWLARAARSVGLEDWREGAPMFYDIAVRRPSYHTHAVEWYLETLKPLGVPVRWDFEWLPARPQAAKMIRRKWAINPAQRLILISPGARWANKRWPVECYAEAVRSLGAEFQELQFAVIGGRDDVALGAALAQAAPGRCLDLTGQTSLPELAEWVRMSDLVVSNDTGPMHIAAALGKPVVALFGPTDPRRTGPFRQLHHVLQAPLPCAPCCNTRCHFERHLACLREISPAVVCGKIRQLLPLNTALKQGVD
jgi:lipopolysaccharide heptosyltransferase II